MNVLPFPYVPLSKRCTECGEWKMSTDLQDGWCDPCRGVQAPHVTVITPAPSLPKDWTVVDCSVPGVAGHPYDMEEAEQVARSFGGRVWTLDYYREQTKNKTKALGSYPHPGQKRGRPAKYGAALQNSKGEE